MSITGTFTGVGEAPSIESVRLINNRVRILFSEEMDLTSILNKDNYSVQGAIVLYVTIDTLSSNRAVYLTLNKLLPEQTYTVTVTGVKDLAGNTIQ